VVEAFFATYTLIRFLTCPMLRVLDAVPRVQRAPAVNAVQYD
jgi:hypothetical protein